MWVTIMQLLNGFNQPSLPVKGISVYTFVLTKHYGHATDLQKYVQNTNSG